MLLFKELTRTRLQLKTCAGTHKNLVRANYDGMILNAGVKILGSLRTNFSALTRALQLPTVFVVF